MKQWKIVLLVVFVLALILCALSCRAGFVEGVEASPGMTSAVSAAPGAEAPSATQKPEAARTPEPAQTPVPTQRPAEPAPTSAPEATAKPEAAAKPEDPAPTQKPTNPMPTPAPTPKPENPAPTPEAAPTPTPTPTEKPADPTPTPEPTAKPTTHTHNWQAVTEEVKVVDQPATEGHYETEHNVPVWICTCGQVFYSVSDCKAHQMASDDLEYVLAHGGYKNSTRDVDRWVEGTPEVSHMETVVTGYICTECGETKPA